MATKTAPLHKMCFTPQMSATFFGAGALLTYLTYKDPTYRKTYIPVLFGFYSIMELLQTFQYSVVNQCESPLNVASTEFAYLLIILQPLLWNFIFYLRSGNAQSRSIFKLATVMCLAWIAMNIYHRISYDPKSAQDNCGLFNNSKTCTYRDSDSSHLYWKWKTAFKPDMTANYFMYLSLWFIPALLVPETRFASLILIAGATVGWLLSNKYSIKDAEFPAVWCFISIPLLALGYVGHFFDLKLL